MENSCLQIRYNVMSITSLLTYAGIKGGSSNHRKDVYFVRCIGTNSNYLSDIEKMDRILAEREKLGQGKYERLSELSQLRSPGDVSFYTSIHDEWEKSGKQKLRLKMLQTGKQTGNFFEEVLCNAFLKIGNMFCSYTQNASETMIRNFRIKLLYWLDSMEDFFENWNEKTSYKLVYYGTLKKQEYLYLYFLTMLGIDVMILAPEKEPEIDRGLLELSGRLMLGSCTAVKIPALDKKSLDMPAPEGVKDKAVGTGNVQTDLKTHQAGTFKDKAVGIGNVQTNLKTGQAGTFKDKAVRTGNVQTVKADAAARKELDFEELALLASSVVMITIQDEKGASIGTGSGIMLGAEGYILTNNHVTSGGRSYSVRIEDDEKSYYTEELIKYNTVLDLALIRIPRKLKPLAIYRGEKDLVRGQKVVAIGSPLGLFNSVSNGIISGFRSIEEVEMIQFTAPISHGSSGGAVLNMYGEVIGISTAGIDNGQNINLAVHYRDILRFVRGFI